MASFGFIAPAVLQNQIAVSWCTAASLAVFEERSIVWRPVLKQLQKVPAAGVDFGSMDYKAHLWEHGYAILRGVYSAADVAVIADEMERLKVEALRFKASYRD